MKIINLCLLLVITLSSIINVFSRHRHTHRRRSLKLKANSKESHKFISSVEFLLGGIAALTRNIYTKDKIPTYIPSRCHDLYDD